MMFQLVLNGIFGILVMFFDGDDRLVLVWLWLVIDWVLVVGLYIFVVNGNIGEFYVLIVDEVEIMCVEVVGMVVGCVLVLVGVGCLVKDVCWLVGLVVWVGVVGLMVYQLFDFFVVLCGVVEYVRCIVDVGDGLLLMLYLCNDVIGIWVIVDLCVILGVIGVKWVMFNLLKLVEVIVVCDLGIIWVGGLVEVWVFVLYVVGVWGFILGLINIWLECLLVIYVVLEGGNYVKVCSLIVDMVVFEEICVEEMNGINVIGVKVVLVVMGQECGLIWFLVVWLLIVMQQVRMQDFLILWGLFVVEFMIG